MLFAVQRARKESNKTQIKHLLGKMCPENYLHLLLLLTDKCRDQHVAAAYRTPMIAKKEHAQ